MHEGLHLTLLLLLGTVVFQQTAVSTAASRAVTQQRLADAGDNITLKCSRNNNSPIRWLKHFNHTIAVGDRLFTDDPRYLLLSSTNFSTLTILNISRSDTGLYQCHQQRTTLKDAIITKAVQLLIRFSPIIFNVEPEEVVTGEGNDIYLLCNATGHPPPNVTWRRTFDDFVFAGRLLNISNIKKADGGVYSCEAENGYGQKAQTDVHVNVEFAPELSSPSPEVLQAVNYTAELLCLIEAFPVPDITWLKDEEEITVNDSNYIISIVASGKKKPITEAHLQLTTVRRMDYGNYSCRASNRLGETSLLFTLIESPLPILPLIKEDASNSEDEDKRQYPSSFNVTGFILGMMPPLWISFYIILHLGFRSRYAEERPEEEGGDGLDEIAWEQGLHFTTKF